MKKILIEDSEKKRILGEHKKLRYLLEDKLKEKYKNPKILSEQTDWRTKMIDDCEILKANSDVVIPAKLGDVKVIKVKINQKFVDDFTKKNPKATSLVAVGYTWIIKEDRNVDVFSSYVQGNVKKETSFKFNCVNSQAIEQFKKTGEGGPWYTKDEATKKDANGLSLIDINNPNTFTTIDKFGMTFYHPAGSTISTATSKKQQDWITYYENQGWKTEQGWLGLSEPEKEKYEKTIIKKDGLPPEGLVFYKPIQNITQGKGSTIDRAKESIKNGKFESKDCKDYINNYWDLFVIDGASGNRNPDKDLKTACQNCIRQHYNNWPALMSGKQDLDKRISILTGESGDKIHGIGAPLGRSEWRLRPQTYQP